MIDSIRQLLPGTKLNNAELCNIFLCSTQGGMRRSTKTNSLIIVSNHVKSIYEDRWIGDTFHYTGMGTKGDQSLNFSQNKTLKNSNATDISVYLFEVFIDKEYTYIGKVQLSAPPYFETQPDENGLVRKACVFPLKLLDNSFRGISEEDYMKVFSFKSKRAQKLTDEELQSRAINTSKQTGQRQTLTLKHDRNPWVAEYAKRKAKGICQLCEKPAPFSNPSGIPYLEVHHIIWLANGGEDSIKNTVALCPNCHRKMHTLNREVDIKKLQSRNFRYEP